MSPNLIASRIFYQFGDRDLFGIVCPILIASGSTVAQLRAELRADSIAIYRGRTLEDSFVLTPESFPVDELVAKYKEGMNCHKFRDIVESYNQGRRK